MIQLYCFGESGNSYKAALPLELSGLDWEPVFVDFFNGAARTPEYLANVNEMGEAPVMVDGDVKLAQSGVIQDYISGKTGRFGGETPEERREVLRWVLWDNHKLSSQAGTVRFLMNFLPEEKRPAEVIGFLQGRLKAAYRVLDAHLTQRDWIVGTWRHECGFFLLWLPFLSRAFRLRAHGMARHRSLVDAPLGTGRLETPLRAHASGVSGTCWLTFRRRRCGKHTSMTPYGRHAERAAPMAVSTR